MAPRGELLRAPLGRAAAAARRDIPDPAARGRLRAAGSPSPTDHGPLKTPGACAALRAPEVGGRAQIATSGRATPPQLPGPGLFRSLRITALWTAAEAGRGPRRTVRGPPPCTGRGAGRARAGAPSGAPSPSAPAPRAARRAPAAPRRRCMWDARRRRAAAARAAARFWARSALTRGPESCLARARSRAPPVARADRMCTGTFGQVRTRNDKWPSPPLLEIPAELPLPEVGTK